MLFAVCNVARKACGLVSKQTVSKADHARYNEKPTNEFDYFGLCALGFKHGGHFIGDKPSNDDL